MWHESEISEQQWDNCRCTLTKKDEMGKEKDRNRKKKQRKIDVENRKYKKGRDIVRKDREI